MTKGYPQGKDRYNRRVMADVSSHNQSPRPILILGPTAGGKSDLAIELALALRGPNNEPGEVLSADSMQIYKLMDAGTAKPSPQQRATVPHHLIDQIEPTQRFTVADWLSQADALIESRVARGIWPIVVGGTNLYIQSLLEGMFDGPGMDEEFRRSVAEIPAPQLHERLRQVDPPAAERLHPNDQKRITRALEVFHLTGQRMSDLQQQWTAGVTSDGAGAKYRHNPIVLGLNWPVEAINRRINLRVKAMFFPDKARQQEGVDWWPALDLVTETRHLHDAGSLGPQACKALGYQQVLEHLAGQCSLDDAFERTKILTRRYAKTQRSWLKRFRNVKWLDGQAARPECVLQALEHVRFSCT